VHSHGTKPQNCIVEKFIQMVVKLCYPCQAQGEKTFLSTSNVIKVRSPILSVYAGFLYSILQRYWRVPNLILARYILVTLVLIHVRLPLQYCGKYHPMIHCIKASVYPRYWGSYLISQSVQSTFCTCSPSSLGMDLIVKSAKENLYIFIWAS
jgi:hypothetical protein